METNESFQIASEIQARISQLESLFEQPLKDEMESLKQALLENPAATELLMDEDIGALVQALRRITATAAIASVKEKAPAKPKKAKLLSKEELDAALAAEGLL